MAKKKPRTPPPPRTVQAPKSRSGKPVQAPRARVDTGGPWRQRKVLYAAAGTGIVALVAAVSVFAFAGGKSSSDDHLSTLMTTAGCSFKTVTAYVPKGQGTHVPSLTKKLPWNTDPPSNGQHYPLWAVWGFYTNAVNPRMVVHDEEHGGIILWWGSKVSDATVEQLRAYYNEQPDGTFGTPYPKLGDKIAITAWTGDTAKYRLNGYYGFGHIAICPRYDTATRTAFEAFRNLYRGHGPEGIPLSADEPGMGPT